MTRYTLFFIMAALLLLASPIENRVLAAPASSLSAEEAQSQFEGLKKKAGDWAGKSTKGWNSRMSGRVIARGTAVLFVSEFTGGGQGVMATVFFLDRGQLKLTHYCEAGNQPTLVATGVSQEGKLEFTFESATGIASRDQGHMDRVVMKFLDDDTYTARWTWYADGKERWLEDILYRRVTAMADAR